MRVPSHAPAVRHACGRPRVLGWVLGAVAACGLAGIMAWLSLGTAGADAAVKAIAGLGTWILCSASAWYGWRSMPVGHLCWDGVQWLLEGHAPGQAQAVQGWPQVHLDLQAGVLLSLQPAQGRVAWLWLERRSDPLQWLALRRAIYSPARLQLAGMAETMGAASSPQDDGTPAKT